MAGTLNYEMFTKYKYDFNISTNNDCHVSYCQFGLSLIAKKNLKLSYLEARVKELKIIFFRAMLKFENPNFKTNL